MNALLKCFGSDAGVECPHPETGGTVGEALPEVDKKSLATLRERYLEINKMAYMKQNYKQQMSCVH